MRKKTPRLKLRPETIRVLTELQLREINGGALDTTGKITKLESSCSSN